MRLSFVISAVTAVLLAGIVRAEQHTIRFDNKCGKGTPQLVQGGKVLSSGQDFVSNGAFASGIAYLQTGECLLNGEHCLLVEMTLGNPTTPGSGSSTDLSLIAPHAFNVPTSFSYFGGCDGQGATCDSAACPHAFFQSNDNQVQVQCQSDNVNLLITFCPSGSTDPAPPASGSQSASTVSTSSSPSAKSSASTKSSASASSSALDTESSSDVSHTSSSATTVVSHTPTTTNPEPTIPISSNTIIPSGVENAAGTPSSTPLTCRAGSHRRRRRFTSS